jgi:hypothetical protein
MQTLKAHKAGRRQTARDEGWRKWHIEKAKIWGVGHRIIRSSISAGAVHGEGSRDWRRATLGNVKEEE